MDQADTDANDDSMVTLFIGRSERSVPRNETLLGCFQYLRPFAIVAGGFFGRAECATCEVLMELPWGAEERVLACQTRVLPGMRILELSARLRDCLKDLWS